MEETTFADLLPLEAVRTAPGEYDIMGGGRRLWFMEGASLADWVCQSVNGYDSAISQLTTTTRERDEALVEVERLRERVKDLEGWSF